MPSKYFSLVAVASILALIACAQPETDTAPPAAAEVEEDVAPVEGDLDPTVVDPEHYTAEFENERVRILRIVSGPGEESPMHHHPESVAVFLTDGQVQMTLPDGSAEEMAVPVGSAVYSGAEEHQPKNIADVPLEVVEIELKSDGSSAVEASGPDATVVDADHYTAEFENDWVRILRIAYGAGEESVMHFHPDSIAVFLTDHLVQMTMADGSTQEISAEAGEALFVPAGQHQPKNIADSPWDLVLVELK
jgi:quercetin dioxygenase-like cupin family protein